MMLLSLSVTASGQSLRVNDTIVLTLPEAKRLAFIKLNYYKLDSITKMQSNEIELLSRSIESKRLMLDKCYTKNSNLKDQISLLKTKHNAEVQIYTRKKTFLNKINPYIIGLIAGYLAKDLFSN